MTVEAQSVRSPAPRTMPGRANWWVEPAVYFVVLLGFTIYSFWSIALGSGGNHWEVGPYLSPFYSPLIRVPGWPFSPALFIFWAPLLFRATCYYYRKAYYRAFFWDPPACAVREPRHGRYRGERAFPFVLNNLHRFFLYLALVVLVILWIDTVRAFWYHGGFYLGIGSLIMLVNVVLLTGYTFSCHALRHLVGGSIDCYSCVRFGGMRHGLWELVSVINPRHGAFAWASLFSVVIADVYIRLVSVGAFGHCLGTHLGC